MEWQPIETAPENEHVLVTHIITFVDGTSARTVSIAERRGDEWLEYRPGDWDEEMEPKPLRWMHMPEPWAEDAVEVRNAKDPPPG